MTRFTLADLEHANAAWRANCGPAALAAICDLTLDEVRTHFSDFPGYTNPTAMLNALRSARRRITCIISKEPKARGKPIPWPRYGIARIQWEMPPGVPARALYRYTHWVGVSRLQPMAVSIDPEVRFGRPVLRGTRVDVAVASDLYAAGEPIERIAREFRVDDQIARDAIAWDRGETEVYIWDVNQLGPPLHGDGWAPIAWWTGRVVTALTRDIPRATGKWHVTHSIEVERP